MITKDTAYFFIAGHEAGRVVVCKCQSVCVYSACTNKKRVREHVCGHSSVQSVAFQHAQQSSFVIEHSVFATYIHIPVLQAHRI